MAPTPSDHRLLATTRGQILALLRRSERTVAELAQVLNITENGVRAQLAILERDGLVERSGVRRGERKPAHVYRPTAQAERLFPKAHESLLRHLLDVLAEENRPADQERLLRAVGREMAAEQPKARGDMQLRLKSVSAILAELGGVSEIEASEDGVFICGYSCPLLPLVRSHPELCKVLETLLSEVLEAPVRERCERSDALWCWFEVSYPPP